MDRSMIDAWLAEHGGPRRFARGDSADFFALQRWLFGHGYILTSEANRFFIRPRGGDRKKMKWTRVLDLVDTLRCATGLETIRPRS